MGDTVSITYIGSKSLVEVPTVGCFKRGEPKEVTTSQAERLLADKKHWERVAPKSVSKPEKEKGGR